MTDWSAQAIARRIMTKTDENRIEPPLQPERRELPATVVVTDIRMPFGSMVTFMVKWAIASIPAAIILFALAAVHARNAPRLSIGRARAPIADRKILSMPVVSSRTDRPRNSPSIPSRNVGNAP
jgi:hypothetical protein